VMNITSLGQTDEASQVGVVTEGIGHATQLSMLSSASSRALRLGSVRLATTNVTTRISTPTCRRGLLTRAFLPVTVATSPSKQRHTTSYAASAQSLASERVRAARVPSDVDIEEAELDAEVLSPGQIQLRLSDRAAEVDMLAPQPKTYTYAPSETTSDHRQRRSSHCVEDNCRVWRMSRLPIQARYSRAVCGCPGGLVRFCDHALA
jgi:hypothetical protein